MSSPRYLALLRPKVGAAHGTTEQIARRLPHADEFSLALNSQQITLVASGRAPLRMTAGGPTDRPGAGVVLGTLFRSEGSTRVAKLDPSEQRAICATRGARLLEDYWGRYVAVLADGQQEIVIVRSPFGELPCLYLEVEGGTIVASDVDMLIDFGFLRAEIDWSEIARHLGSADLRRRRTALLGVEELRGGERLRVRTTGTSIDTAWSPWMFARRNRLLLDRHEAVARVGHAVRKCTAAWATEFDRIVLMLSGGLDSSIVAASLGQQSTPFSCLTLVTRDASGDERDYARLVTEALSTPLDARLREVGRIQPERSEAAHLPCPSVRLFAQEWTRIAADVARSRGADALFTGGGGDNVFCSLQSAAPAADRLLTSGLGTGFWRAALDVSALAPASLWAVVTSAVKRAWIRGPAYRHRPDIRLLSPRAAQIANSAPPHPWLLPPAGALPGSATHIALLAFAQSFVEGQDPFQLPETVTPLLSQPVVEACLQVPSWLWIEDGRNRVVARRAFAADLPAAIVERRSKGTPDSFSAEIFEANRRRFLELLVHGELARHDMIDVRAVSNVLEDPRPVANDQFHRILQLVDVEAWARAWRARRIRTVDRVTA